MLKHTQTFRWQQPTNFLSMFDNFMGLALKRLSKLELSSEAYSKPCQTSNMKRFEKIVNGVNYFSKMLYLRCLIGF